MVSPDDLFQLWVAWQQVSDNELLRRRIEDLNREIGALQWQQRQLKDGS